MASERDRVAHARDELAAELDARLEQLDLDDSADDHRSPHEGDGLRRFRDRRRAGLGRDRAAVQRDAAARDRALAAADRQQAAADRAMAAEELAAAGIGEFTES
jgi:hypothetical protein